MWIRRIRRQEFKIPLCNPSGGNLLRQSCQTSTTDLLCENSQQPKHVDCFRKRAPPDTSDRILNADPTRGVVNVGCGWDVSAWNRGRWLVYRGSGRDYQAVGNFTPDDMGILLVLIWLGVTELKKIRIVYLPDLLEERGEKGQFDLVCVERPWIIGLMVVSMMSYSHMVIVAWVLSGVGLHTLNFLHSSASVFSRKYLKRWWCSLLTLEAKEISIYILKQRKPSNFKRKF